MDTRAVTISYFHSMIIVAKLIHDNDATTMSVGNFKRKIENVKSIFNFVDQVFLFCLVFGK